MCGDRGGRTRDTQGEFQSEIKLLYKKLESEVIRKNIKQSRILTDGRERDV